MLVENETDTRHHHTFEPAFENRRHRAPPRRIDEHERLRTLDDSGMPFGHRIEQRAIAVVGQLLVVAHRRTELLGIQIEHRDGVPCPGQRGNRGRRDRMVEAVGVRVGDNDNNSHSGRTLAVPSTIAVMESPGTAAGSCSGISRRLRRAGKRLEHGRSRAVASPRPGGNR